jgi:uncharacterized repeat protein (TIGR03803 family)
MQRTTKMPTAISLLSTMLFVLSPLVASRAAAKENVLYSFKNNGTDGFTPYAGLTFDKAGNLYGTTNQGSSFGGGTVFELKRGAKGTWTENVLYSFGNSGTDGIFPYSGVVFDHMGNLYGTASAGGSNGFGTVFELIPSSKGQWTEKILYNFSGNDGASPFGAVIFDKAGNLYSTTSAGGKSGAGCGNVGCGTVFELTPGKDGQWTEKVLYLFNGQPDGSGPFAGPIFDKAGNLYGTTNLGGSCSYCGTVFELKVSGHGKWIEQVLYRFGSDAINPEADLTFDGAGHLFGATLDGGPYFGGNTFELKRGKNGKWTEATLHDFGQGKDGAGPVAGVIFDAAGRFYGTTTRGGVYGGGTVYRLKPTAQGKWSYATLYSFKTDGTDGSSPSGDLIFDKAGHLYSTTSLGTGNGCGGPGCGTVFELTP